MEKPDARFGKSKRLDLTNRRFGRWLVMEFVGRDKHRRAMWRCLCDCGSEKVVATRGLICGDSQSCGCRHIEIIATHGSGSTKHRAEFIVWKSMMLRCYKPSNNRFYIYGARGIRVCERWHTFSNFFSDMGERPTGMSIERDNNDRDYEPSNCRWASNLEQARNKRNTLFVIHNGERRCLKEWCEILGANYHKVWSRMRRGKTLEQSLREN